MKVDNDLDAEMRFERLLGAALFVGFIAVFGMSAAHFWPWPWLAGWLKSDKASGWAQALCALLALPLALLVLKLQQQGEHRRERERDRLATLERLKLTGAILMQAVHVFNMALSFELGGQGRWRIHRETLNTAKERVLSIPVLDLADAELIVAVEAVVYSLRMAHEICMSLEVAPAETAEGTVTIARTIFMNGWLECLVAAETVDQIFASMAAPGEAWDSKDQWIAIDAKRRSRIDKQTRLARERSADPQYPKVHRGRRSPGS